MRDKDFHEDVPQQLNAQPAIPSGGVYRPLIFTALFAAFVLFANLGGTTLWDRDEPRNAGCAQEMLRRGDWIVPTFNGELRTHKPVLLYWLTMASYAALGVNEFSARLPSALLGTGTVLLTFLIALRLFHVRIAMLSGCVVATTLMFDVASRAATPDSVLIFCVTATFCLYVHQVFRRRDDGRCELIRDGLPSWRGAVAIYAMMGLAVLAKGPIGLVLPTAVIGMFLLVVRYRQSRLDSLPSESRTWRYRGRLAVWLPRYFLSTCWQMRPVTAIAACLAVAAPWYVLVGIRTEGEWLRGFFLEHNVHRAAQAMEGHNGSVFYYPVALLAGFFPWSIFALPVLLDTVRRLRRDATPETLFAVCWAAVWIGLFTIASTKLPSYITPVYPAVAMLVACHLWRWSHGESYAAHWWPYVSMGSLAIVGLAAAIGLPIAAGIVLPQLRWLGGLAAVPLVTAALGWRFIQREKRQQFLSLNVASAAATMLLAFGLVAPQVSEYQRSDELVAAMEMETNGEIEVASYGVLEPSWVFYLRAPIWELADEDQLGTGRPQDQYWSRRRSTTPARFLQMAPGRRIITTAEKWETLRGQLPGEVDVLSRVPYFLHDQDLVVIGTRQPHIARSPNDTENR